MKSFLLATALLFTTALSAQTSTKEATYTGKIGISTIQFTHAPFPVGSTATITTGDKSDTYTNCAEDPAAKVQKLCLYDSKQGFNNKKFIQVHLSAAAKNPPKEIMATYTVNGTPVKFKLVRKQ